MSSLEYTEIEYLYDTDDAVRPLWYKEALQKQNKHEP